MQNNELERIHHLETKTAILDRDSTGQTKALEKMEDVIDRAETHIEALNRTIIIYDERLRAQEHFNNRIESSLKELNQKLDNFMVEMDEKIDDHEEKRKDYLQKLRDDIILQLQANAKKDVVVVDPKDDGKFKIFKFLVDNWKYIGFAVAILGGLLFHKWGLLTAILGITSNN